MSEIFVDGIRIDPTVWIDAHIAQFKDKNELWAVRRENLRREIMAYDEVLRNFGTAVPPDAPGEAHTKAYLVALRQTESELTAEFREDS